jgi:hypothetical protein
MNGKILGLLAVVTMAGSMTATAQVTTLNFQGGEFGGLASYLPTGFVGPQDGSDPNFPTSDFTGQLIASITLDGSVKAHDLSLVSYSFGVSGYDYVDGVKTSASVGLTTGPAPYINVSSQTDFCDLLGDCIDITTSKHGRITGAVINISGSNYNSSADTISINSGGASIFNEYEQNGTCQNQLPYGVPAGTPYTGPTINPCILSGSTQHGGWKVTTARAPEIDPASATSGLTLLLGGLAVLRGRRKI